MARALWKGAISFGLVNIPVELHAAEDRKTFQFSMLDRRDLSPVGYKRYSKASGKDVEWDDIVKGYEFEKDEYVVLSDEDFRRANVKATQTIDIHTFVPAGDIPLPFFDTPYYLLPSGRSPKAYALLREALLASQRIAVGSVVIRTRQHLAAVLVNGKALMLNTLRYADELVPAKGLDLPAQGAKAAGVTAQEVELAQRLVADMSGRWEPGAFKDTYHDDLMARIQEKIKRGESRELTLPDSEERETQPGAQVINLTELLKQSLAQHGRAPRAAPSNAVKKAGKPALRVVASARAPTARAPTARAATKASTKRKRA